MSTSTVEREDRKVLPRPDFGESKSTSKPTATPKPQAKQRPKSKGQSAEKPSSVAIPPGMPFKTPEEAAKLKRTPKKKRLRTVQEVQPKPVASKIESTPKPVPAPASPLESQRPFVAEENPAPPAELSLEQQLDLLSKAAKANKPGAVEELRKFLDDNPAAYRHYGDTAKAARIAFATLSAGDSLVAREAILKHSDELLNGYLEDGCCNTERILCEQVVLSHMRVNYFDGQSATDSTNPKLVGLLLKQQEQAQNALFKAITKLADFRRLKAS